MIYAAAIAITVLGCGDNLEDCEFISQSKQAYETKEQCEYAIPPLLLEMQGASYPVITGHCDIDREQTTSVATSEDHSAPASLEKKSVADGPILLTERVTSQPDEGNIKLTNGVLEPIENGFALVLDGTYNLLTNITERTRNSLKRIADSFRVSWKSVPE